MGRRGETSPLAPLGTGHAHGVIVDGPVVLVVGQESGEGPTFAYDDDENWAWIRGSRDGGRTWDEDLSWTGGDGSCVGAVAAHDRVVVMTACVPGDIADLDPAARIPAFWAAPLPVAGERAPSAPGVTAPGGAEPVDGPIPMADAARTSRGATTGDLPALWSGGADATAVTVANARGRVAFQRVEKWYRSTCESGSDVGTLQEAVQPRVEAIGVTNAIVDLRFSCGSASSPIFGEIATRLAAVRHAEPDRIEGAGHAIYFQPDLVAASIRSRGAVASG